MTLRTDLDPASLPADAAPIAWTIESDRTGFTTLRVTLAYLDTEVAALDESTMRVWRVEDGTAVSVETRDTTRNTITFTTDALGTFVLVP